MSADVDACGGPVVDQSCVANVSRDCASDEVGTLIAFYACLPDTAPCDVSSRQACVAQSELFDVSTACLDLAD
jgi:hypothetical protein